MAAKKRKTLPKDFGEIIRSGDVAAWEAMYEKCEIDAYYDRQLKCNALGYEGITPEFIRWAVAKGMDPNKKSYGFWGTDYIIPIEKFPIEHQCNNLQNVAALIEAGADINKKHDNKKEETILEYIFSNSLSKSIVETAKFMLAAGAEIRLSEVRNYIWWYEDAIVDYEDSDPEWVEKATVKLKELYELFGIKPGEKRMANRRAARAAALAAKQKPKHDGVSPIQVRATRWEKQFEELWKLLVPKSGRAPTVQGEVVRIVGNVIGEIVGNSACNWSREYKKLPQALPGYLAQGNPLEGPLAEEADRLARGVGANSDEEELYRLEELVVAWVLRNPEPIAMPQEVDYKR